MRMMKVLNAGCGYETFGTHFIDKYPKRAEVVKCDLDCERIPFGDCTFDRIYTKSLVEHLKNLGNVMQEFWRVLKEGGEITIITDNAAYWLFHVGRKKEHYGDYEKNQIGGKEDRHYALFTPKHLRNYAGPLFKRFSWGYYDDYYTISRALKTVNWVLRKTPFRRFAYPKILVRGVK